MSCIFFVTTCKYNVCHVFFPFNSSHSIIASQKYKAYTGGYKRRIGDSSPDQKPPANEIPPQTASIVLTETIYNNNNKYSTTNTEQVKNNNKIPDEIIDIPKENGVHSTTNNVPPQPAPRRTSSTKESVTSDDGGIRTMEKEESTTVSSEVSLKITSD